MTTTWAERTSNPEAQRLIRAAKAKCVGCRMNWRVDKRTGYKHRHNPGGLIECKAAAERTELRAIAAKSRAAQ